MLYPAELPVFFSLWFGVCSLGLLFKQLQTTISFHGLQNNGKNPSETNRTRIRCSVHRNAPDSVQKSLYFAANDCQ
jgi:hypothetical protein